MASSWHMELLTCEIDRQTFPVYHGLNGFILPKMKSLGLGWVALRQTALWGNTFPGRGINTVDRQQRGGALRDFRLTWQTRGPFFQVSEEGMCVLLWGWCVFHSTTCSQTVPDSEAARSEGSCMIGREHTSLRVWERWAHLEKVLITLSALWCSQVQQSNPVNAPKKGRLKFECLLRVCILIPGESAKDYRFTDKLCIAFDLFFQASVCGHGLIST